MSANRVAVSVFFTAQGNVRAKIDDRVHTPYEVTLGGGEWLAGKGCEHAAQISKQLQKYRDGLTVADAVVQAEIDAQVKGKKPRYVYAQKPVG